MNRFRSVAAAALVSAACTPMLTACDSAPPVQSGARQVTVVGTGEVRGVPDTLTADVAIETIAPDVTAAMNQGSARQQAVIDALTGRGIDTRDIATTAVNLAPQYGENSVITGYRATNALSVRIRRLDTASAALAAIVDAGGNAARINAVTFSIGDDSTLITDARARAFDDARNRARQYAQLAGLSLGQVISISEASASSPPVPKEAPMAAAVPLQPGEQTVGFSVTVVWELQ